MSENTYGLDDIRFCFGEKVVADLRQQIIFEFLEKVRENGVMPELGYILLKDNNDNQLKAFIEKVEGGE